MEGIALEKGGIGTFSPIAGWNTLRGLARLPDRSVFQVRNRLRILARARLAWSQDIGLMIGLSPIAAGGNSNSVRSFTPALARGAGVHGRDKEPYLGVGRHILLVRQTQNLGAALRAAKFSMPIRYAYFFLIGRCVF